MPFDYAIHSDLVVHWTGKDIETQFGGTGWYQEDKSQTLRNPDLEDAYLQRLEHILAHGLWMTDQPPPEIGHGLPSAPCTCFTELKLSESRKHATQYGRLGVALKRPFLFERAGRPVTYYGTQRGAWMQKDRFLHACAADLKDKRLMHFFRPMNSGKPLNYDLYSESEWRIVYGQIADRYITDPRDSSSPAFEYFRSLSEKQQEMLRYLIRLDGWLALIVYPSLTIRNQAQAPDGKVRQLIRDIKCNRADHANKVEGVACLSRSSLDMCRNF